MGKRKIILKYVLKDEATQVVEVASADPKVLSIQLQGDEVVMWVECPETVSYTAKIIVNRQITGQHYWGEPGTYIATVQEQGGSFVGHWFVGQISL